MTQTHRTVLDAALALPPGARAQVAEALWASLENEPGAFEVDEETRAACAELARQRIRDLEEGKVELVDGDEVARRLRARIKA
jgi:putative addiction module component (TIGR02574 family)